MESVQGGGGSPVHPEKLFAKSCWERPGTGNAGSGRGGRGADLGGPESGTCPGPGLLGEEEQASPKLPASSLGSPALPAPAMPSPLVWATASLEMRSWQI